MTNKRAYYCPLPDEDYSTWSIRKFRRHMEFWEEETHMAGTKGLYEAYKQVLDPIKDAFIILHPRAYQNWLREYRESFH